LHGSKPLKGAGALCHALIDREWSLRAAGSTSGAKVMQRLSSRAAKAELEAQAAAQAAKSIQLSTIAKAAAGCVAAAPP
jgi:hypothetical protein